MRESTRWGIAGLLGAGASLAAGELLAGLFTAIPSPLAAIGGVVVDWSPSWLKDFAIATFGTADKTALTIGTTIIAIGAGWLTGVATRRNRPVAPVVFSAFGFLGFLAARGEPDAAVVAVVIASGISVGVGLAVLVALGRLEVSEAPTDGLVADPGRRRFIGAASAAGVAIAATGLVGRRLLDPAPVPPGIAIPAPATRAVVPTAIHDLGLPGLTPIVVPNNAFYRIDTALVVPRVDPASWTLRIEGMVDRPITFGYDDLLAMDLVEEHVTIACVSNEVGGRLVGNARWTGVPLTELLDRAGVMAGAGQVVGRSVDGFTAGFPLEAARDGREPMVAVAMNGDPLPAAHGFPARLIVPGLYGYVSATKWLQSIQVTTWEGFDGYWVPRGWSKEGPIKTQSRIDLPAKGARLPAGSVDVAGVAWAPLLGIAAVEISVDGGDWEPARLSAPLSSRSWVQWHATIPLSPGVHRIAVRATDGTGYTQTEQRQRPGPDGATGHHTIEVSVS